jgi:tRNA nucleotidyltransferase/poly(A) polymerase
MAEIKLIVDSQMRDKYVEQLVLDKFLAPIEKAQHTIQNTAKHSQYMAEVIGRYDKDHNLTQEQAREVCQEFRFLAIQITNIDSLYDLRIVYNAATILCDRLSEFQHKKTEYTINYEMRKNILNKLNTCIAVENNFQIRLYCMNQNREQPEYKGQTSLSFAG